MNYRKAGDVIIYYPRGKMTVNNAAEFESDMNRILINDPDCHILINLRDVEYLSSSSLRIFLTTARQLKGVNRTMRICSANSTALKIFEIINIEKMIALYPNEEEALASFAG